MHNMRARRTYIKPADYYNTRDVKTVEVDIL
jgi:hypothetical protein